MSGSSNPRPVRLLRGRYAVQEAQAVLRMEPTSTVVVYGDPSPDEVESLVQAGVAALAVVPQGKATEREISLIACIAEGMSNEQVGRELGIKPLTVKRHVTNIGRKWGMKPVNRARLVTEAFRRGLIT